MGILAVMELADKVEAGMPLDEAVRLHLTTGFFNPIRIEWHPVCMAIIERYKGGDQDLSYGIPIPNKPDVLPLTAESLVEDLHLDPFLGGTGE